MARRSSKNMRSIELLQSELGAVVIEVRDRSGKILWQRSHEETCGYKPEGIDSESQQVRDKKQGDQQNG